MAVGRSVGALPSIDIPPASARTLPQSSWHKAAVCSHLSDGLPSPARALHRVLICAGNCWSSSCEHPPTSRFRPAASPALALPLSLITASRSPGAHIPRRPSVRPPESHQRFLAVQLTAATASPGRHACLCAACIAVQWETVLRLCLSEALAAV